jgi:glycosyltransferase involved in cell wall biosynthesis
LPYSFNESYRSAKGKYICYLGDDDKFYPDHIETLVNALGNSDFGVAYTDLYKVHFKWRGNERVVHAKNVEIQRDFDRMSLLRFNNMLHVSLMHRRDLLEKTGLCRDGVTSLIDWDLNRRLCFYADFVHIPKVTGEYYALIDGNERISNRARKNPVSFTRNLLDIRHYRPDKPWSKVIDLSILIPMVKFDKVINRTLRHIHLFTWYPHRVYLTCPAKDVHKIKTIHPNVSVLPLDHECDEKTAIKALTPYADGLIVSIEPDKPIGKDSIPWIEGIVNRELERVKE